MQVVIFGATGPTGKLVVQQALEQGYEVTAFARNPTAIDISHPKLKIVQGDVYDAASVERAIAGQDAVISTYGVPYTFKPVTVYSVGGRHIIAAMKKQGVKRLVCVTSGGTHPGYDKNAGFVFSGIIKRTLGRTLYADMRRLEQQVMASNLDWTIARPARLINVPNSTTYQIAPGYSLPRRIITKRVDLAKFLVEEVSANKFLKQGVAVLSDRH